MPAVTKPAHEKGDFLVDYEDKKFEDVKAKPGEKALVTFHTVAFEGSIGLVAPHLYAARGLTRPITQGDNKMNNVGYSAGPGWNACTGLGAPIGASLVESLATAPS